MIAATNWVWGERIRPGELPPLGGAAVVIHVSPQLLEKRIYLFLDCTLSATAFFLGGEIICYDTQGAPISILPVQIADFTGASPTASAFSLINSGGSPVGDSCVLRLAQPFDSTNPIAVMQPLRVPGSISRIEFRFTSFAGVTGWRVFLGCLSAN